MKSNVEIIQDIVEQVINQKNIDIWDQYTSQDYISRGAPYTGTGVSFDSSGHKHIIDVIAPGGPADGKLQVGDELLWEEDEHQRWSTYEDIKQGILQGYRGSKYRVGVRRGDQTLEYEFTRDLINGFDTHMDQSVSNLREFVTNEFPDLKATINQILADGDMVVSLLEYRGTHADFEPEAVWREAWFARLSEGKIAEDWSVFDGTSYFKQLVTRLFRPAPEAS